MLPMRLKEKLDEHSSGVLPLMLFVISLLIIALLSSRPAETKEEIAPVIQEQLNEISVKLDRIEDKNNEIYDTQTTMMLADLAEKGLLNDVEIIPRDYFQ